MAPSTAQRRADWQSTSEPTRARSLRRPHLLAARRRGLRPSTAMASTWNRPWTSVPTRYRRRRRRPQPLATRLRGRRLRQRSSHDLSSHHPPLNPRSSPCRARRRSTRARSPTRHARSSGPMPAPSISHAISDANRPRKEVSSTPLMITTHPFWQQRAIRIWRYITRGSWPRICSAFHTVHDNF